MPQDDLDITDELGDADELPNIKYEITSYGADYTVDGIVKRLNTEDIFIPPFQRGYIWTHKQASRFIESLLLGLPVPGIFLSKDNENQRMIVIDGQQRLKSLQFFYKGIFTNSKKVFSLKGVEPQFEGSTYENLSDEDRRKLDNSIIHATIVQQDKPVGDNTSIFYLFERINTNGTPLQPQEIRSSIYSGEFNDLLAELNNLKQWREIMGPENKRLKDRELILRFFALFYMREKYSKPMREFLNHYMGENKHLKNQGKEELQNLFTDTIKVIHSSVGEEAFKPSRAVNAAVYDSVMIGIASRLTKGKIKDKEKIKDKYISLLSDPNYVKLVSSGTADELSVFERIEIAIKTFVDVQ